MSTIRRSRRRLGSISLHRLNDGLFTYTARITRGGFKHTASFDTEEKAKKWLDKMNVKFADERCERKLRENGLLNNDVTDITKTNDINFTNIETIESIFFECVSEFFNKIKDLM